VRNAAYFIAGAAWIIENAGWFIGKTACFMENPGHFIENHAQFIGITPWLMIFTVGKSQITVWNPTVHVNFMPGPAGM